MVSPSGGTVTAGPGTLLVKLFEDRLAVRHPPGGLLVGHSVRVLLTKLTLIHVDHMHGLVSKKPNYAWFIPWVCLSWVLMTEKSSALELHVIQLAHELQMPSGSPLVLLVLGEDLAKHCHDVGLADLHLASELRVDPIDLDPLHDGNAKAALSTAAPCGQ